MWRSRDVCGGLGGGTHTRRYGEIWGDVGRLHLAGTLEAESGDCDGRGGRIARGGRAGLVAADGEATIGGRCPRDSDDVTNREDAIRVVGVARDDAGELRRFVGAEGAAEPSGGAPVNEMGRDV